MSKSRLVSRGQVLCTRVPVSDFDLRTHPRAGSTRGARGVGAGSRVRRLAMVWWFVGSPAGRSHEGGGGGIPVVVVGNSSWDKGETGGTGSASKGHTIAFFQDVETFASILPRVPDELPFIVLKDPSEKIEDRSFRVRKQKLLDALLYLKSRNEDYRHIVISRENADLYPEDDIIQSLPQLDPQEMKIPDEEPTAANEDSAREQASTVDIPGGQLSVVEKLRSVLQKGSSNDAPAATKECPRDAADPPQQVPWPKRSDAPVSEFTRGYFSMAFPDLFPDGRGDIMTKPRLGKSPLKKEYFNHLLNVNRAFAKHHSFMFVATNILRRHEALTRGNVFAKRCADGLTMAELKQHMEEGNEKLLNKLMYFFAPIPGTKQHL
ncbi:hypothetical protein ACOMHN_058146 [Nucella lapillus]